MTRHPLRFLLLLAVLAAGPVQAVERWMLMARHGECAPVRSLERKFPDLGAVADPEAFVRFVRAKGLVATIAPVPTVPAGSAFEVRVPTHELALVFATQALCRP